MSDRDIILRILASFRRRLRLNRALQDLAVVLGLLAIGLLLWRVLYVLGTGEPAWTAVAIVAALLLWALGLVVLLRSRWSARTPLSLAATVADSRAGLKDELKTAYWFLEHPNPSPWTAAQIERAAMSARRLNPALLLPVRLGQRTWAVAIAAVLILGIAWLAPPLAPWADAVARADSSGSVSEARQVQQIRELMAQVEGDAQISDQLEQALKTLERDASPEEKQRALAAAQRAIEQHNLQAASTREGLYQLSERLHGKPALEEVANALKDGDPEKAAQLLQRMADRHRPTNAQTGSGAAGERMKDKDLETVLKDAAGADDPQQREVASAAAQEAVDRLNKIAEQLDVQQRVNQAAQALSQMQLAVAQRSVLSAGRFSQQTAQNAAPSPESGRTTMPGGTMYRAAAVAQENQASQQQEGTKTGAALGDSQADPVVGNKVTPLEVQLQREAIPDQAGEAQDGAAKNWFYTESKEQKSVVQSQEVQARHSFAEAQSTSPEGISIRHRKLVKDYFMNLREGSQR